MSGDLMLLITGSARPTPGERDRLVAAARAISAATQDDVGCLHYAFTASLDDDSIVSTELWRDREALAAHMNHPHTQEFLRSLDGVLDGAPVMTEIELSDLPD
jgi:quinol monooxygenase YgiN